MSDMYFEADLVLGGEHASIRIELDVEHGDSLQLLTTEQGPILLQTRIQTGNRNILRTYPLFVRPSPTPPPSEVSDQ